MLVKEKDKQRRKQAKSETEIKKVQKRDTDRGAECRQMCVRVWNEGRLSTQMENGPVARSAHSCPLAERGSNRAFCMQHKDVANVCASSTHWSAE